MKRFISCWQGFLAGVISLIIYLLLPPIIRSYDPTAGVFDAGYLAWVGMASFLSFWTVFIGWLIWQIAFASIDKEADKHIKEWFKYLSPKEKWYVTQISFFLMLLIFLSCLFLIPLK